MSTKYLQRIPGKYKKVKSINYAFIEIVSYKKGYLVSICRVKVAMINDCPLISGFDFMR